MAQDVRIGLRYGLGMYILFAARVESVVTFLVVFNDNIIDMTSVVVKDLRLKDEDKDEDLKICPRGSSRTTTLL